MPMAQFGAFVVALPLIILIFALNRIKTGYQIRPSKFGGSFNQPNVPTINVVVDMVAPQRRIAKIIGGEVDVKA